MPSPGANRTTATLRQQVYAQLRRAIEQVKKGKPALVDTICRRGKGAAALT